MKTRLLIVIGALILVGSTEYAFAEDLHTFEIDGYDIITNTPNISTIDMDWNSQHLSIFSVNFTEPYTGQFQIQIPKNMPRMMNLDFETTLMMDVSSLSGKEQEKDWNEHITEKDFKMIDDRVSETESLCHYVVTVELTESDYFKIVTGSVASGRWETVAIENKECDMISTTRSIFPLHGNQVWESMSPLKQFKSGVPFDEIQCRDSLVLVTKNDVSPACVKPLTAEKLIQRGWIINEDSESLNKKWGKLYLEYQSLKKSFSDNPNNMTTIERMAEIDGETMRIATILSEREFTIDVPETESEKTSGVFYPRIHISIFPDTESSQYVDPDFVTIGPGSQVTWSNYNDVPVSLNSVDPDNMWATSVMQPDGYDTVTFEETGIYEYKGNTGIHGFIIIMDDDDQLLESKFSEVFGPGSPLMFNDGLEPVLLYDNCKRYVYWLNEHGHKDIHVPEDYPRYPPWGNQIFPLVEFCTSNGKIVNVGDENSIHWEFEIENEN